MALQLPSSRSPSKVASFKDCGLAFKFAAVDRLPEPPSPWSTKGTLVHRALELLFCEPPGQRSLERALAGLGRARDELRDHPDFTDLELEPDDEVAIIAQPSEQSVRGLRQRTSAIWSAIERACEHDDFRPRRSRLCDWCAFRSYCPAWGGDPAQARELVHSA